ncbi:CsbD family protein [Roseobacter fucihabitans]
MTAIAAPADKHTQSEGPSLTTLNLKGYPMNWDQIEGKWKEMTGNVKTKWGDLTDDDIAEVNGDREALEGKVQAKYGKTKEEAKKEVDDFMNEQ